MKLKAETVSGRHQERICLDTVRRPSKALLGPPSYSEAIQHLLSLGYSEEEIENMRRISFY